MKGSPILYNESRGERKDPSIRTPTSTICASAYHKTCLFAFWFADREEPWLARASTEIGCFLSCSICEFPFQCCLLFQFLNGNYQGWLWRLRELHIWPSRLYILTEPEFFFHFFYLSFVQFHRQINQWNEDEKFEYSLHMQWEARKFFALLSSFFILRDGDCIVKS